APAVLSYLQTNDLTPSFNFHPPGLQQHFHAPTPLHLAASVGSAVVVNALLIKGGADPGMRNPEGKTAFEIAGERGVRDTFRVARWELGEEKWDWDGAGVPGPISRKEVETREKAEREEADKEEKERRAREKERLRVEEEQRVAGRRERKFGKGVGLAEKTGAEKREEESRGMTPEMRMRLERERRARAAEERMRRLQG
ncbi:hypothetical protein LTS18_003052, partial [Coniosporium uncinatum]